MDGVPQPSVMALVGRLTADGSDGRDDDCVDHEAVRTGEHDHHTHYQTVALTMSGRSERGAAGPVGMIVCGRWLDRPT